MTSRLTVEAFKARCRRVDDDARAWRAAQLRDPCVYCGGAATGLDHIRPQSAGGQNAWWNRAPACHACDLEKAAMPMVLYLLALRTGTLPPMQERHRMTRREPPTPPLRATLAEILGERTCQSSSATSPVTWAPPPW